MADGRSRMLWSHTSAVLCMIANVNRDPKKSRPFRPAQFNPYLQPRRRGRAVSAGRLADEVMAVAGSRREGRRRKT